MQNTIKEGDFYLHGPWGGKCITIFKNNCLWMHRYIGPFPFDYENGYRIWKCHSPRDTERLQSGQMVWVQWDNRDWKRLRYDCQSGDFYVEHGGVWHPFWCLHQNGKSSCMAQPTEKRDHDWYSMPNPFSMDVDQDRVGVSAATERTDDQRRGNVIQFEDEMMMGRKRCDIYHLADDNDADGNRSMIAPSKRVRMATGVANDNSYGM